MISKIPPALPDARALLFKTCFGGYTPGLKNASPLYMVAINNNALTMNKMIAVVTIGKPPLL